MPRINLSNVSDGELQRLLAAGRVRSDATLLEVIEQEIATRTDGPGPRPTRPPRMVLVELDDLPTGGSPGSAVLPASPLSAAVAFPQLSEGRRIGPATLAAGVVAGMALGWWVAGITRHEPPATAASMAVQPAAYVPPPLPAVVATPARQVVAEVRPPVADPPPKPAPPKVSRHRRPEVTAVKLRRKPPVRRTIRTPAGDPQRLARLYEEGVRKLKVANPPR
jgi:hypothetical protein